MSPDTLLNRPRVSVSRATLALPLTVVISTAPPPPLTVISPLMVLMSIAFAACAASPTSPLTVLACRSPPASPLTSPLTVCSWTSPWMPLSLRLALTSDTDTALLAGMRIARCASPLPPQLPPDWTTT